MCVSHGSERKCCKSHRSVARRESQKRELFVHSNTLVLAVDDELFEKYSAKNYFSCHSKELAIDVACLLSQLLKRLSKALGFNVLIYNLS